MFLSLSTSRHCRVVCNFFRRLELSFARSCRCAGGLFSEHKPNLITTMALLKVDLGVTPETTYSLAGKQIKFDSASIIEEHLKELRAQKNVQKLDLSGNTIGVEASEALSKAILEHKDTLVEVDLSDIYTGRLNTEIPQSLRYILPALLRCSKLQLVNLSDNAFGLQTIDPIEDYLAKAVTIEHLILSNNGMGPFAGARIGTCLFKLAKAKQNAGKPSLKSFICGRNRLEDGSSNHLSIGLRNHKDLQVVRLYQNGIRPKGIARLLRDGLSRNKELNVLDLQDNTFTVTPSSVLADNLSQWPKLKELNLNDCLLKAGGSLALAKALVNEHNQKLETLRLQYNELEEDALKVLATAVKNLPNLKVLELNGNRFEEDSSSLEEINAIFENRGQGEVDELDDLEEIDSEEEDDEESVNEAEEEEEEVNLDQLEEELAGVSAEDNDVAVDSLADKLSGAHIN